MITPNMELLARVLRCCISAKEILRFGTKLFYIHIFTFTFLHYFTFFVQLEL